MKRNVVLAMILALVVGYGASALAGMGPPNPCPSPTHDCWIETECGDTWCIIYKCCTDCVWEWKKGKCVETCTTMCAPIS